MLIDLVQEIERSITITSTSTSTSTSTTTCESQTHGITAKGGGMDDLTKRIGVGVLAAAFAYFA
ncbi:MAG: hypothetical protein FJY92_03615, partial [Candidatus Hydrogenedentes bacterium]|nr:hypothetical protein [Candidatus Hydrogenedentota bacterium]